MHLPPTLIHRIMPQNAYLAATLVVDWSSCLCCLSLQYTHGEGKLFAGSHLHRIRTTVLYGLVACCEVGRACPMAGCHEVRTFMPFVLLRSERQHGAFGLSPVHVTTALHVTRTAAEWTVALDLPVIGRNGMFIVCHHRVCFRWAQYPALLHSYCGYTTSCGMQFGILTRNLQPIPFFVKLPVRSNRVQNWNNVGRHR